MNIGTAKPSIREMSIVPHHLFDIINPDQEFSLAEYRDLAQSAIGDIQGQNKIPILVGGSGQYIRAILEGWSIPHIPPDRELREKLETEAIEKGPEDLYRRLQEIDPQAAQKIDMRNTRRIIRALEVSILSGTPFSSLQIRNAPDYHAIIIGLTADREELYRRVDERVDEMLSRGFVAEVQSLMASGYGLDLPSMSSIGYSQIAGFLKGETDREEAVRQFKTANHRFVRHQYAWFRLNDARIHWFEVSGQFEEEVFLLISNLLHEYYQLPD
jgi:tRNA dimethylallyltransferase